MINIKIDPDFARFRDVLLLKKAYARPPLFDFYPDLSHQEKVLDRPVKTPADTVEFWRMAGYDYVQISLAPPCDETHQHAQVEKGSASTHRPGSGVITDLPQFRSRRWSWQGSARGDLKWMEPQLDWMRGIIRELPAGMKLNVQNADIFTRAWELTGFENFCVLAYEDPDLIRALMDSLGAAAVAVTRRVLEVAGSATGTIMYSDDIAYTEELMLAPSFFEEFLFPHISTYAKLGEGIGAPLIYHSDGRLYRVFDSLHRCGVRAIQPLEPKSMDPLEIKRRWPGKFCLMGNIDLDTMSRGTEEAVETLVRDTVARLNAGGGYMPGVSNTVPFYVNFANYRRMIETVYSIPDREIPVG
jgi:uroporphyrinogen decarboxylase